MQNKYWVYKIISPSGKIYIGITSNIIKRFCFYKNHHLLNQTAIYNSILKYGWDNHVKEILFISLTKEEAERKEIELIKFYKDNKSSLNLTDGGLIVPVREINPKSKPILQYDLQGNFIKEWDNAFSIELELNFSSTNIGKVCRKRTFYQHGFLWIFKQDVELGLNPLYTKRTGLGRTKKVYKYNNRNEVIEEYSSMKEAIKNCKLKNPKRNILKSIRLKTSDKEGNYWSNK